jgi:hypothetical protein
MRWQRSETDERGNRKLVRYPLGGIFEPEEMEVESAELVKMEVRHGALVGYGLGDLLESHYENNYSIKDTMLAAYEKCRDADRTNSAWFHNGMRGHWEYKLREQKRRQAHYAQVEEENRRRFQQQYDRRMEELVAMRIEYERQNAELQARIKRLSGDDWNEAA